MRVQEFNASPIAGAKWPKLKLTPQHSLLWDQNRAAFLWAVPCFSDIWMALMVDKDGTLCHFTDQIPTAATDDKLLYINPKWYFKLTLDECIFVDTHEVMHAMFGHAGMMYMLYKLGHIQYLDGVRLPYDGELFICALDYVLNDQIVKAKIGKMPEGGLWWPELITGDMAAIDAYRLLYQKQQEQPNDPQHTKRTSNPRGEEQGPGSGKSFDQVLKPGEGRGKTPAKAMSERSEAEWETTIASAMESARQRGQLPANLDRIFSKRLEPKADWRDLYMNAVSKKVGNDRYTWDNLNPQLIYRGIGCPGRTSYGCNLVIIVRDSSGSINDNTTCVFGAETRGILELARPKRIIIVDCDAEVHRWEEIGDLTQLEEKVIGGWGTAFEPVFAKVEEEGEVPDLLIYLTDLMGSFPANPPGYPVIWGCIDEDYANANPPPFGEMVMVPAQAEG